MLTDLYSHFLSSFHPDVICSSLIVNIGPEMFKSSIQFPIVNKEGYTTSYRSTKGSYLCYLCELASEVTLVKLPLGICTISRIWSSAWVAWTGFEPPLPFLGLLRVNFEWSQQRWWITDGSIHTPYWYQSRFDYLPFHLEKQSSINGKAAERNFSNLWFGQFLIIFWKLADHLSSGHFWHKKYLECGLSYKNAHTT